MNNENTFTVGGTVQASNGLYISRRADAELLTLCLAGKFAYVLTPRQLGKSSLMVRTAQQLTEKGGRSVIIDLSQIGVQVTPEQWYLGMLSLIEEQLNLDTNVVDWWRQRAHLGVTQRLTRFFDEVLLREVDAPVVVFVDEIDTTLSLGFTDDFFAAIRYFYNARALSQDVRRLSFVLIGVATPGDLIRDPQRTPFNIGQRVDLTDFTFEEALPLAAGLGLPDAEARQVLGWVMKWTNGHPYLTQRLCRVLTDDGRKEWSEADVDRVVAHTFFGRISEEDNNLQFVRDMLTKRAPNLPDVLYTYRDVLRQTQPVPDEEQSLAKSHLKLSGVAQRQHGELTVRNPIYAEVFNEVWIKEHLPVNWYKRARRAGVPLAFALVLIAAVFFAFTAVVANRRVARATTLASELTAVAERERTQALEQSKLADEEKQRTEISLVKAQEAELKAQEARRETQRALESAKQAGSLASMRGMESERSRREAEEMRRRAEDEQRMATANLLASKAKLLSSDASLLPTSALLSIEALRLSPTGDVDTLHHIAEVLPIQVTSLQHAAGVEVVAFSPDGKYLATGSRDSTARLWRVGEDAIILTHSNQVAALAFSPDSKILATTSRDRDVRIWDTESGKMLAEFAPTDMPAPKHQGFAVAFSQDGKYLANIEGERVVVRDWQLQTVFKELPHDLPVIYMAMSPNGRELVTVGNETNGGFVKSQQTVWDWRTGEKTASRTQSGVVTSLTFAADGKSFAVGYLDGAAEILDLRSGRGNLRLLHKRSVNDVAFSPDAKYVATACDDNTATVWDTKSGQPLVTLPHGGSVKGVRFSSDGAYLATAAAGGAARVWQWELQRLVAVMPQQFGVNAVAFSPDDKMIASAGEDETARVWKFTPTQLTRSEPIVLSRLAFSHDDKLVALTQETNHLELWMNPGGGRSEKELIKGGDDASRALEVAFTPTYQVALAQPFYPNFTLVDLVNPAASATMSLADAPSHVTLSRNGKYAAAQLNNGQRNVHVWDLQTRKEIAYFAPTTLVSAMSLSADGEYLALGNYQSSVELWKVAGGVKKAEFDVKTIPTDITCSPDGKYIAVDRKDDPYAVSIWDTTLKKEIATIKHSNVITAAEFSSDGRFLATGSVDGTARIWDIVSGFELSRITYDHPVMAIAFSEDGSYVATATDDGVVHTWFRHPDELVDVICNRLTRNLTQDEWTRYVGKQPYRKTCSNLP